MLMTGPWRHSSLQRKRAKQGEALPISNASLMASQVKKSTWLKYTPSHVLSMYALRDKDPAIEIAA